MATTVMLFLSALMAHWLFTFGGVAMVAFGLYEKYRHKEPQKRLFWGVAIALLVIASYQAWLDEHHNADTVISQRRAADIENGVLRGRLEEKDKEIEYLTTHQTPSITVNTPAARQHTRLGFITPSDFEPSEHLLPFRKDQEPKVNIGADNLGNVSANVSMAHYVILSTPDVLIDSSKSDAMFNSFLRSDPIFQSCGTLTPTSNVSGRNGGCYTTAIGKMLTEQDVKDLNNRGKALCALGRAKWRDESGHYITDSSQCVVKMTPLSSFNWGRCPSHNEEINVTSNPKQPQ